MNKKWERNYSILITPDNVKDAVKMINRSLREALKNNRQHFGESVSVTVGIGVADIEISSVKVGKDGDCIKLYHGDEFIGSISIDDDLFAQFSIDWVEAKNNRFDYRDAFIRFCTVFPEDLEEKPSDELDELLE
jgi:hypothetical protein